MPATRKTLSVSVKPVSESKTIWLSALTILFGVAVWFGFVPTDKVTPERIEAITGTVLTVVGAANAVIRMFFTKAPLTTNTALKSDTRS